MAKIKLKPGQEYTVELETLGSAGYEWLTHENNEKVTTVSLSTKLKKGAAPGASAITEVTIKAIAAGNSNILLVQKRAWENDEPPFKTYKAEIIVV